MLGSSVRIASPVSGERMGREERERMRREEEAREREVEASQRDEERRKVIRDLVELNVIKPAEAGVAAAEAGAVDANAPDANPPEEVHAEAGGEPVAEGKRGRGRPVKDPSVESYVGMSFRVPQVLRQRIKLLAAGRDCSVADLFDEAFGLLFDKYGSPES